MYIQIIIESDLHGLKQWQDLINKRKRFIKRELRNDPDWVKIAKKLSQNTS